MLLKRIAKLTLLHLLLVCIAPILVHAEKSDTKYTNKDVMRKAMKGGLCKKVAKGEATSEEEQHLLELFIAMSKNDPPKGSKETWNKFNEQLIRATKAVINKEKGAKTLLGKAANCSACHKAHRPKQDR